MPDTQRTKKCPHCSKEVVVKITYGGGVRIGQFYYTITLEKKEAGTK